MTKKIIITEEEQRQRKLFAKWFKTQSCDRVRWNKSGPSGGWYIRSQWRAWNGALEANKESS